MPMCHERCPHQVGCGRTGARNCRSDCTLLRTHSKSASSARTGGHRFGVRWRTRWRCGSNGFRRSDRFRHIRDSGTILACTGRRRCRRMWSMSRGWSATRHWRWTSIPTSWGIAAQPFWLFWRDGQRSRSHAPDFFARRADGTGVVTDCRPAARIKLRDEVAFAATARACASMGWVYRRVSEHDRVWLANVQWLAGYRHPRHRVESTAATLVAAFAKPQPLIGGARSAGDPVAVLPVLHHLLWSKELMVDLSQRLESMSIVSVAAAR